MTIRLEYFQYLPRNVNGWGTRKLRFGSMLTAVQAPNGVGKTPVMKGIVAALGHEIQFPPEILERCSYAEVGLDVDGRSVTLTRTLSESFELRVRDGDLVLDFTNQADYGRWLVEQLAGNPPALTSKQGGQSSFYATTLLPALWVDQDHGWTKDYWVPSNRNFIVDQRQEVIRFLVGLPPKHAFRSKEDFELAKGRLDRTEKSIELQRFVMESIGRDLDYKSSKEDELTSRRSLLESILASNKSAIEAVRSSSSSFDERIVELERTKVDVAGERQKLLRQRAILDQVMSELSGEEDILEANATATDLMRQICGQVGCQMFHDSERSFGRSLLFLRDQIKDLRFSSQEVITSLSANDTHIRHIDAQLHEVRRQRDSAVAVPAAAEVVAKLDGVTEELVSVSLTLARFHQYREERDKFEKLIDRREQEASTVQDLRPNARSRTSTSDARILLSESLQSWLVTLGTKNINSAHVDDDFSLFINEQKFTETSHQSGSSRTRIILAFHAALLEVSLRMGGNHPGWLLFDAPKQHELKQEDFDAYMERLQILAHSHGDNVQVVFSAADVKTQLQVGDELWTPQLTVDGESRFLGNI